MDELTLQTIYISDPARPVTVSASQTACSHLVVTPRLGTASDSDALVFAGGLTLVHTNTGRTVASHHDHRQLTELAATLTEFDWEFDTADHFARVENTEQRDAIAQKIRAWQMNDAYTGEVSYFGDDEATKAARNNDPAGTMLREQLDWWVKHSEATWQNPSVDDNPQAWHANIATTVNGFGLIYLLAVLRASAPDIADVAARNLVVQYDCGDSLGEWVYQWREELAAGKSPTLHGIPDSNPLSEF